MPEWRESSLGEHLTRVRRTVPVEDGVTYPTVSVTRDGGGLGPKDPFVGGFTNYDRLYRVHDGDVVVRTITAFESPVAVAQAAHDGTCVSQVFLTYEVGEDVLPAYLRLVFQTPRFWREMRHRATGTVLRRKTISDSAFCGIPVLLPPLDEQRRIIDLMSSVDSHIEALEAEAMAANLLWATVIEREFTRTDCARLPLAEVVRRGGGRVSDGDWIDSKDQSPEGIPLLQLADIGRGEFLGKSSRYVSVETFRRLHCKPIASGDLLVARMAQPIGRTCAVPVEHVGSIVAVDICMVSPGSELVGEYLMGLLNSDSWTSACEERGVGSTRKRISRRNLEAIRIPVPPIDAQLEAASLIGSLHDAQRQLTAEATALRALRSTLLTSLLSRSITISESYDHLLEAAS